MRVLGAHVRFGHESAWGWGTGVVRRNEVVLEAHLVGWGRGGVGVVVCWGRGVVEAWVLRGGWGVVWVRVWIGERLGCCEGIVWLRIGTVSIVVVASLGFICLGTRVLLDRIRDDMRGRYLWWVTGHPGVGRRSMGGIMGMKLTLQGRRERTAVKALEKRLLALLRCTAL